MKRILVLAVAGLLFTAAANAAERYTGPMKGDGGVTLRCTAVNVRATPQDVTIELVGVGTTTCPALGIFGTCTLQGPVSGGFGFCHVSMPGTKASVRASLEYINAQHVPNVVMAALPAT